MTSQNDQTAILHNEIIAKGKGQFGKVQPNNTLISKNTIMG